MPSLIYIFIFDLLLLKLFFIFLVKKFVISTKLHLILLNLLYIICTYHGDYRYELKNQSVLICINVYLLFRININYNKFSNK